MKVSGGHAPKAASLSTELAPDAPPPPNVSPLKLMRVLVGFGAACGLALALAYQWTQPMIAAHETDLIDGAVREVLQAPARVQPLYVTAAGLSANAPRGVAAKDLDKVYLGFDSAGRPMGFAMTASGPGFAENIKLIFGYNPTTGELTGMKTIDQRETPGIGDKIEKDAEFTSEFRGVRAPLHGVKRRGAPRTDPHELDMITGATISSRAVIAIINRRVETIGPMLKEYAGGRQ